MSEARTSLDILIIPAGHDENTRPAIESLERFDTLEQIGIGYLGIMERTNLGLRPDRPRIIGHREPVGSVGDTGSRRTDVEVFADLEGTIDRRTCRTKAKKEVDKVVKSKTRKEIGAFNRLERAAAWPFGRLPNG